MTEDLDSKLAKTLRTQPTNELSLHSRIVFGKTPRISLLLYYRANTQVVTLEEGQQLIVGRDPTVEVTIDDEGLSRRHAQFDVRKDEVWVQDLGSTNGTKLNGKRINRERMMVGDEIAMGSVTASIHILAPADLKHLGIDSHDHFFTALEDEVERGRTFERPAALFMLRPGEVTGEKLIHLVPVIREHLRSIDRLALYSEDTVEILLPEADHEATLSLANKIQIATGGGSRPRMFFGIAFFPDSGTSAGVLLDGCREALRKATSQKPIQYAIAQKRSWEIEESISGHGPVIHNPVMIETYNTIHRLANTVIPVLLIGDTGTGKEVLARAIHESGNRHNKRMACINCGAIPSTLVESVLFGHERGAFTGATQASKGIFEEADGGTILLDEVGELSASAQAALLRVLEVKKITRVGSSKERSVDVRIIAATHRDLETMTEKGTFRQDLFYRLNAMTLVVPPLRDRPDEIAPLTEQFIKQANEANNCDVSGITKDAMRLLHQYSWPGNVRELRNAIERAVVITLGDMITTKDLPKRVQDVARNTERSTSSKSAQMTLSGTIPDPSIIEQIANDPNLDYKQRLQRFETHIILDALKQTAGNRTEAAKLLKLPVRTLSHKINNLGIKKLGYGRDD